MEKNVLHFSVFVAIALIGQYSLSDAPIPSVDERLKTGGAVQLAEWLKTNLPDGQAKCASEIYLKTLGLEEYVKSGGGVGDRNFGLISHFKREAEANPCFADIANKFYTEISESDKQAAASKRPRLNNRTGDIDYPHLQPGWLFKKAMDATGGNPNAAIALIGMCGHDDYGNPLRYSIDPREQQDKQQQLIKDLQKEERKIVIALNQLSNTSEESKFLTEQLKDTSNQIEHIRSAQSKSERSIACPSNSSAMYVPQSLSPDVDVPPELVEAIAKVQRPLAGSSTLPAKYYHFYAAAFMGCQLAKCGVSPDMAAKAQRLFSSGYRALRLCPNVRSNLQIIRKIEDELDVNFQDPKFPSALRQYLKGYKQKQVEAKQKADEEFQKLRRQIAERTAKGERVGDLRPPRFEEPNAAFCKLDHSSILCQVDQIDQLGPDQRQKMVDNYIADLDASILYRRWYVGGGSFFGYDLPCTTLRLGGPENIAESDYFKDRPSHLPAPPGSMCNMPGWSTERCTAARNKLATWDVDFAWTATQHEIGARFGATQCRKQDVNEPLDKRMCNGRTSESEGSSESGKSRESDLVQ